MFTGIITETGKVKRIKNFEGGKELNIECSFAGDTHKDESIAVNGVCLTVVDKDENSFKIQCVEETLRKTTLGNLSEGKIVNLERSLTIDKAIDGHIVQGHVDTVGTISTIVTKGNDRLISIKFLDSYSPYIVGRGSIAVDGISLTIAREEETEFTVAIIPYTWEYTNLREKVEGDQVNLEFDIFGKYIVRYLDKHFQKEKLIHESL
ncbi:MAG: riboflavin synthase [Balneolaceae bacterium]